MKTAQVETMNILVVDDDPSVRETLRDIFEDKGHNVVCASSGEEAIEAVKKSFFDVLMADIKMPGINGVDTFLEVKKISPETAVIMMTGFSMEELVKKALQEGVYTCIYKPFDLDRILQMLEEIQKRTVILIVDDHLESVETLRAVLETRGQKVMTARSGQEAADIVRTSAVDIVLLDVVMPEIDGVTTLRQIKRINPEAAVIMMTAYSVEDMVEDAINEGAYACLSKPFNLKKVIRTIEEIKTRRKQSG